MIHETIESNNHLLSLHYNSNLREELQEFGRPLHVERCGDEDHLQMIHENFDENRMCLSALLALFVDGAAYKHYQSQYKQNQDASHTQQVKLGVFALRALVAVLYPSRPAGSAKCAIVSICAVASGAVGLSIAVDKQADASLRILARQKRIGDIAFPPIPALRPDSRTTCASGHLAVANLAPGFNFGLRLYEKVGALVTLLADVIHFITRHLLKLRLPNFALRDPQVELRDVRLAHRSIWAF
jgi:hypothetical protein